MISPVKAFKKIVKPVLRPISKPFEMVANTKPMRWVSDKFEKNPMKALAYTTIASIIIKDGVAGYFYVNQSINNKKIPPEKRLFVTSLDATNTLLMIVAQLGMFMAFDNDKMKEKIFGKLFDRMFSEKTVDKITESLRDVRKQDVVKQLKKVRKGSLEVFGFLLSLAAATIIGKRIIVPFLATPLASSPLVKKILGSYMAMHPERFEDCDEISLSKDVKKPEKKQEAKSGDTFEISRVQNEAHMPVAGFDDTTDTNLLRRYLNSK